MIDHDLRHALKVANLTGEVREWAQKQVDSAPISDTWVKVDYPNCKHCGESIWLHPEWDYAGNGNGCKKFEAI